MTRAVALSALLSLQSSDFTTVCQVEDRLALERAADATAQQ